MTGRGLESGGASTYSSLQVESLLLFMLKPIERAGFALSLAGEIGDCVYNILHRCAHLRQIVLLGFICKRQACYHVA